jgi:DNA-binding MarR family transcriptional regulator
VLSTSHCADSSHDIKFRTVSTATPTRADAQAELQDLMRSWRAVMAASRPRWGAVDLTFTQLRALSGIAKRDGMRITELSTELGVGLAAASALADRMARRGLVARKTDPDDRRIVRLEVSTRGRHLLERLERGSTEHFGRLIARMTPPEREALTTTLRAFVRLSAEFRLEKEASGLVTVRRASGC